MKLMKKILAATTVTEVRSSGTAYYKVELEDAIKMLQKNKSNMWLIQRLEADGWDAIDFKQSLFGSYVDGSVLYICVTDGSDIQVGEDSVDPEKAMEEYGPDMLASYIIDADDKVVCLRISEYDLAEFDIDEAAEVLLHEGKSFVDMMEHATTLPQLTH